MAKRNIKDFLSDDTFDLSVQDLQDVPVKELAAFPKITSLDLSNNKLSTLNKSFAVSLTHLVKLDLARNELKELPKNFGLLVNLKYLDLYKNKLESLPLSFGNLKALRWLDMKENPLEHHWQQIVGPCLNAQDCKNAAKNVVNIASIMMEEVEAEVQRSQARQKQLEENEENELRELAKKREKQREKKRRRNAAKLAEVNNGIVAENGTATTVESIAPVDEEEPEPPVKSNFTFVNAARTIFIRVLKVLFFTILSFGFGLFILQFINEPLYKTIMLKFHKETRIITSLVPGHWRVNVHKLSIKVVSYLKLVTFNIWTFLYKISINSYTFVTTDPKFEIYLTTFINTFLSLYVKICNSISLVFNLLSQVLIR
uniref:Leucine-rich repeat-containing protein 59 n=1 Tax=Riptortus pedestris TaxID=329032 RepID=R4WI79_RIPPE|nr:conserved hypothetical protein [Riptortus pedestris]